MHKKISATQKGLITSVVMIAAAMISFYGFDLPVNGTNQYLMLIIFVAGIVWTLWDFKKQATAETKFKNYFSEGFKCFIVVTLLMSIYTYIFYASNTQILDAEMISNNALIAAQGDRTPAEIKTNEQKIRDIYMPMMLGINIFKYLILGALVTVICSGFFSQKKQS